MQKTTFTTIDNGRAKRNPRKDRGTDCRLRLAHQFFAVESDPSARDDR